MRAFIIALPLFGLLLIADISFQSARFCQDGLEQGRKHNDRYQDSLTRAAWKPEGERHTTEQEKEIGHKADAEFSVVRRTVEDWEMGTYLAIGFTAITFLWLLGAFLGQSGSITCKMVEYSVLLAFLGVAIASIWALAGFWDDKMRSQNRYNWEIWGLFGAIGGALLGVLPGIVFGLRLKRRRTLN
jgi:hypothetical protein